MHAIGKCDVAILLVDAEHALVNGTVCDEIVTPPAGIGDLKMCGGEEG